MEGFLILSEPGACQNTNSEAQRRNEKDFTDNLVDNYFCRDRAEECLYEMEIKTGEKVK